jgi:hypothetical protein
MPAPSKCKYPGTSPAHRGEFRRLMTDRGWTVEDLIDKARSSRKTVENLLKGGCAYPCTFKKFADLFEVAVDDLILQSAPEQNIPTTGTSSTQPMQPVSANPSSPSNSVTITITRGDVAVTVSMPFDCFNECEHLPELVHNLANSLGKNDGINPKNVGPGSTIVTLDMSARDIMTLTLYFLSGRLEPFGVTSVHGVSKAISQLVADTGSSDHKLSGSAMLAISGIYPEFAEAVPALITALQDPKVVVRSFAAAALANIANLRRAVSIISNPAKAAVPALIGALQEPDPDGGYLVRMNAAWALGNIGPEAQEAVPALLKALEDSDKNVCEQSLRALLHIGLEANQAIPAFVKALESGHSWILEDIAAALGRFGPEAIDAIPILNQALTSRDPRVRFAVALAIENIENPSPEGLAALDAHLERLRPLFSTQPPRLPSDRIPRQPVPQPDNSAK